MIRDVVFQEADGDWWYIDYLAYTIGPFKSEDIARAAYADYVASQGRCPTCNED